jgi:hypothetical protein
MAAVDPKEILLRNKVLLGAYVLALVPIGLYFAVIDGGAKGEFQKKVGELQSAASAAKGMATNITNGSTENPVFTEADVETLKKRKEAYEAEYRSLVDLVNNSGGELETWFEAFAKTPPGQNPNTADYLTEWSKQCGLIGEKYKAICAGPTGETLIYNEQPAGNELRRFQKRFWVQEAILEALTQAQEGNPGLPLRMQQKLDFPQAAPASPSEENIQKPYDPIPARITIVCPFPRVPIVVQKLLSQKIPMRVTSVRVDKEPFSYEGTDPRFAHYDKTKPRFGVDGREYVFQGDTFPVTLTATEHYGNQDKWLPEPRVKVELMIEAYDFNKIEPPAAASEEGEGEAAGEGEGK